MPDAAILTAAELAHLRAKPIDEIDELDIGVLFDHIDAQREVVKKLARHPICPLCTGICGHTPDCIIGAIISGSESA